MLTGCSGDSSDGDSEDDEQASCPVSACGGDVVGTWNVEGVCLSFSEPLAPNDEPECRDFLSRYGATAEGTLNFSADGVVISDITTTVFVEVTLTDACSQALGGGNVTSAMCDSLEAEYASDPEYESAQCTFASGACYCSIFGVPESSGSIEPYLVNGNRLTMGSEVSDYCVAGDRLTIGADVTEGSFTITATRAP